jgi:uncharacterized protein YacL
MENEQIDQQNQQPQTQQQTDIQPDKKKSNVLIVLFSIQIAIFVFLLGLAIAGYFSPVTEQYEVFPQFFASIRIFFMAINLLFSLILGLLGVRKKIPRILVVMFVSIGLEIIIAGLSYLTIIKYQ